MPPEPGDPYVFRALRHEDFPRLAQWLGEPHVTEWWGAMDVELAAIAQAMKARTIRAYEKAGFRFIDQRDSLYGPAHLMVLDAQIEETDTP